MKINHRVHVFLLLAALVGLTSSSLWAVEDGLGTNVLRNIRVQTTGVIDLGGTAITNWNQVGSTAVVAVLQGATNALNTSVTNISYLVTNTLYNATNALNTLVIANTTGKVDRAGDTMTGTLNLNTNLNVFGITVLSNTTALTTYGNASFSRNVQVGPAAAIADPSMTLEVRATANFRSPYNNNILQIANGASSLGQDIASYNTDSGQEPRLKIDGYPVIINSKDWNALVPGSGPGNVGIGSALTPTARLHVFGSTIIETNLTVRGTNSVGVLYVTNAIYHAQGNQSFASSGALINPLDRPYVVITSSVATVTTVSIAGGTALPAGAGQMIFLQGGVGYPVTLTNGGKVLLADGVPFTFTSNNTMQLIWNGAVWTDIGRVAP